MIDAIKNETATPFTTEQFAHLGDGKVAYVKPMLSDDVLRAFPQIEVQGIEPGMKLFALLAADGSPIMLTDTRDAALANAYEHQLQTVSLH